MKASNVRTTRSLRRLVVLFCAVLSTFLIGSSTAAQELVSYPSQEVAFICGPQLRSNSPLNPYPWFDSTATSKGASVAALLPAKAPRPLTGTVSVNANSSIVTGNGTRFLSEIDLNGPAPFYDRWLRIVQGGVEREVKISSIQSNTQLTLTANWSFASVSGTQANTFHVHQGTLNFNDFERGMYYDTALTMYINYYRTNDAAFLTQARKLADAWWSQEGVNFGTVVSGPTNKPPFTAAYAGLMLRALDGKPEYWDYLYRQVRDKFDNYVKIRRDNPTLYLDLRDGGYAQLYAVMLARVLPNSYSLYPNGTLSSPAQTVSDGAQKRAALLADLEDLAVNYFGRLQKPDGSWRWDIIQGPERNVEQPFMVGLYLESVILLHQLTTNSSVKTNLINQLTNSVRHLYNDAYEKDHPVTNFPPYKWRSFYYYWGGGTVTQPNLYNPPAPSTTACGLSQCGDNSVSVARQLNSTIHHAFGYAYLATGDVQYKTMGDEVFGASFGDSTDTIRNLAADAGGKEYAMNYRASGRYLAWRIADPNPSTQPLTWTEVAYAATEADGGLTTTTINQMATAVATQQLTAGKYFEIIPNNVSGNTQYRINTVGSRNLYRLLSIGGGNLSFWNTSGAWQSETPITTSDVIKVSLEGSSLKIYKNGTLVYTFADTLAAPLEFRMFIWVTSTNLGAGLTSAYVNSSSPPPTQPVTWTEVAYAATESDGGLTTTTINQMATAVATQQLTDGKYFEIIPNNVSGNTQYRINTVGSRNLYRLISFGGGNLSFYNTSGTWQSETPVTTSNVIRIKLEGTNLRVYKDGTLVYTFADTLAAPLEFRMFIWVTSSNLGAGLTSASFGQ
ncbi:MAG TPA: hypothetical protein VJT71_17205 [Pyrinomonadaceae bacterium]|nr:hypothetical protein [Pyrinomonadaceae bacterium]